MTLKSIIFSLLCLSWLSVVEAADNLPVTPFQARYNGFVALTDSPINMRVNGKLEMALRDAGNGQYRMDYELKGFIGSVEARAKGIFQDNNMRPLTYRQKIKGIKQSRTEIDFNWRQNTLAVSEDEESETLPLKERVVDPLSLHLLVMWDMQQNQKARQYTLVSGVRLKDYGVKIEGEETLQTPLGDLRTLRVRSSRVDPGSDRVTKLWLAPELDYLPVQMVHENGGEETMRMLLEEVKEGKDSH
jgi:hypothetical protein